ncbi:MAG: S9 family peptidase [Acidobacteria bacterium]|nr:S9 family peptidase [Acidobacteriota bacterium]
MRTRSFGTLFACMLVLCAALTATAQDKRPMTMVDLLDVPQVGDPQLSPDGRQILFTVARSDWKQNRRITRIWRIQADGSGAVQMTNGPTGESSPRWAPDGSRFAFTARRPSGTEGTAPRSEGAQIFLQSNGGGEAVQLTRHETSVSDIAWSPDGRSIYFTASDPKTAEEKEKDRLRDDVFAFDENYQQAHLWKVDVADGKETRVTEGDFSVNSYSLSRDGSKVVVMRGPNPLLTDRQLAEIFVMNAAGGAMTQLTRNGIPEGNAELSPDNGRVLFTAGSNGSFEPYYNSNLFLVPAAGGDSRLVDAGMPYAVDGASWSKDGASIYMLCNMGVHNELFTLDPASGRRRQWTELNRSIGSWSYSPVQDKHVFVLSTPTSPGEVFITDSGGGAPAQVTRVSEYVSEQFLLPREEAVQWKGADGVTVEGILTYPLDYREGTRYPLAVYTHGGPQSSDKLGFSPWREYRPVLAAKGYAVLRPNYRGSTGYGNDFLRDMVGHYFNQSHQDVMTGVDYLVRRGIADPERMVKFGWSAGGHMTNKIITFTNRFKAASSGAGAVNWISMYAQSDVRNNRTPWFGGTPWQKDAPIGVYWDNSPLKDVWKVTTPTIILVGQNDERVPPPQSVELYRALKSNGVPVHLYMAPREPHGWQELRHELFKMNVELGWFEKHAMKREYTWEKAPG